MPRKGRIDASGALHHIVIRGIERRKIFYDNTDRDRFIERLSAILIETATPCYAWALMPNHVHLLLKTRLVPISKVMQRLLTGYVVTFNRRHRRSGHLFQNRYKSILCQEDSYLLELVRYIHLNPLRAKLVQNLKSLERFAYCGHAVLIGHRSQVWQDSDYVLRFFHTQKAAAREAYRAFVTKGSGQSRRPELTGGGLLRSVGGWSSVKALRKTHRKLKSDQRILGDSRFVAKVLAKADASVDRRYLLKAKGVDLDKVVQRVAELTEVDGATIWKGGKQRQAVRARSVVCYWAVKELGYTMTELAGRFGISQPAITLAVKRGEQIIREEGINLMGE